METLEKQSKPNSLDKNGPFLVGFVNLFKDAKKPAPKGLCFYLKPKEMGILDVEPADVDLVKDIWVFCLLGCFVRRFLGLKAIQNLVDSWNIKCIILPHFNGWIIFQFNNGEDMEKVLARGPYFIFSITLLLRTILERFCFQIEDYSVVLVWVQLHSLPLQC